MSRAGHGRIRPRLRGVAKGCQIDAVVASRPRQVPKPVVLLTLDEGDMAPSGLAQ